MKALFVHGHKFPFNKGVYYYSYGFDEEFFNRYLLVFDELSIIGRRVEISTEESKKVQPVDNSIYFFTLKNFSQLKSRKIRDNIDKIIRKNDYLIVRLPSILGVYVIQRARALKKPYLVEVVGSAWDSLWYQNIYRKMFAPILSFLNKRAISKAPYVVYVTEKYLQKHYPTLGKSISCSNVTLPSVADLSTLNNRLEKLKKLDTKKIIIGTCATLNVYKGQQDIIKAISILKAQGYKVEYQLVGGGDAGHLKSLTTKLGLTGEVKFMGKLKHKDVFLWLDKIDLYVQPSLTEGLPRAVIEAMSRGCPIIGSSAGGIPELIDNKFVYKKGDIITFCDIFKKLTPEIMIEQAVSNHTNSKKYLKSVLYERRTKFFKQFIKESSS